MKDERAVNAEPWEPMPGMVKQQCPECRYFFAAPVASAEPLCPDCAMPSRAAKSGGNVTTCRMG
jgi:hypothetical protein